MLFSTLFKCLKTGAILILLNDYFKRTFPEKYEETLILISFKLIHIYSKGQIILSQINHSINDFIESNPFCKKIIDEIYKKYAVQNEIAQIKDNQIYIKHFTNISEVQFENDKESFYIYSDKINSIDNCINKVILQSQPFITNYELSNIKFILVEVKIADKTFKIDLKTENENFYIVNNIFDKKFFTYYLKNYQHYNFKDNELNVINLDNIYVKIIDNNVNIQELEITDDKFIIIKKDDYIY
jgi:hypothetical protein